MGSLDPAVESSSGRLFPLAPWSLENRPELAPAVTPLDSLDFRALSRSTGLEPRDRHKRQVLYPFVEVRWDLILDGFSVGREAEY